MDIKLTIEINGQEHTFEVDPQGLPEVPDHDNHIYKRGQNYLTLDQAVSRCYERVLTILKADLPVRGRERVHRVIRTAIHRGVPRNELYRIAGQVAKDYEDQLFSKSLQYAFRVYRHIAEGA